MRGIIWRTPMRSTVDFWELDKSERSALLERFPPKWPDVYADHVTSGRLDLGSQLNEGTGLIVGVTDDDGLQALVIEIGSTIYRPDGSIFHITWSLDRARGRRPVDSNALLQKLVWERIEPPISVKLLPGDGGSQRSGR
jgi:hypothetical protein